jgi:hypothetical protein
MPKSAINIAQLSSYSVTLCTFGLLIFTEYDRAEKASTRLSSLDTATNEACP